MIHYFIIYWFCAPHQQYGDFIVLHMLLLRENERRALWQKKAINFLTCRWWISFLAAWNWWWCGWWWWSRRHIDIGSTKKLSSLAGLYTMLYAIQGRAVFHGWMEQFPSLSLSVFHTFVYWFQNYSNFHQFF